MEGWGFTHSGLDAQEEPAPGLGVYSSWLGGLPGWLSGAWWFEKRDMTQRQISNMKTTELSSGRLAMCAPNSNQFPLTPVSFDTVPITGPLVVDAVFLVYFKARHLEGSPGLYKPAPNISGCPGKWVGISQLPFFSCSWPLTPWPPLGMWPRETVLLSLDAFRNLEVVAAKIH
jgi:hypothetical protein